ncbi:MAG: TIGR01458 family HAD-type hydrolase [Chloroflexi bacterium]|nr:TIGR01458 family HAD-type hydrolase [Chloroflexota bacterium]
MKPQAFLFDLDGVFYNDTQPIPGGAEVIAQLRERGVLFRFVTNTTSRGRASLARKLQGFGITAEPREIFCPAVAASAFLREKNASGVFITTAYTRGEFDGVHENLTRPDYVVLGDLGDDWTYAKLNQVLRYLLDGAQLIALGMSRYWRANDGPRLDVGPIASAFAYATGQPPIVLGKPAKEFFLLALRDLQIDPAQSVMVGDDIVTDIGGAQAAGMQTVLVRTGKFRPQDLDGTITPDVIIDSIADLKQKPGFSSYAVMADGM